MPLETKLMLFCLIALAVGLVFGVLKVASAWYEHHVSRHDLIIESKRRRIAYLKALAERDRELRELEEAENAPITIEEDEPELAQAA